MKRTNTFVARLVPLLAAWLAHPVIAQSSPQAPQSDPLKADAPAPTLVYQSAFSQYQALGNGKLMSWKEANDAVGRIGGWREYARQARQPQTPDAPAAPDPHAGHAKP